MTARFGRACVLASAAAGVACAGGTGEPGGRVAGVDVRFHHAHLRAADPAAEMNRYAREHGCEKQLLQGLGVGVRCGSAYLLFDRDDVPAEDAPARAAVTVSGRDETAAIALRIAAGDPDAARRWLADAIGIDPARSVTFAGPEQTGALDAELTHVAFAARDLDALVARLGAAGASPVTRGSERLVAQGPDGFVLEIVRDVPDGPDAYWCPMHPDVRSVVDGTCPICAMTLVPIPPPSSDAYELDVAFAPAAPGRGRLTLGVADRATGTRATSFLTMHERRLHLFVISRALDVFQHVHPELQSDGRFVLDLEVPRPDAYTLVADVYPAGGTPQMLLATWVTPDYRGSVFPDTSDLALDRSPKVVGALQVSLDSAVPRAGNAETLTFHLADARTGAPVGDLEPYLGAPGHLVIASADLSAVMHSHPEDVVSTGPAVTFEAVFPRPGRYKVWAQFQRAGSVVTASFVIDVR